MPVSLTELKVNEILDDPDMSMEKKRTELQAMETEARGLQRAATESPMVDDDGWQSDLRIVEKALEKVGEDRQQPGAATL